jgi:subtilisin family serine protease
MIRAAIGFTMIAGSCASLTATAQVGPPAPSAAAVVAAPADQLDATTRADDERPEKRVLVMLRMAPEHYRPASDYGGAGGYGDAAAGLARRRLAARIARDNHLTLVDNWAMPILGIDCVVMQVPDDEPLTRVADRLSHDRDVAWSQPVNRFTTQAAPPTRRSVGSIPNDRLFAAQPAARRWQLADLHRIATGRGVRVAVIDSMVDRNHPDLRGQLTTIQDFVEGVAPVAELHGTGVAGIIAAAENNGVGIAGVAPGARIMGLRACWQRSATATVCDSLSLARALVYALENGAGVINMSLTGPRDDLVTRLVDVGIRRGVSVVAAVDPRTGTGFPASLPGVTAVASDSLAATGPRVYSAPGRDVPTTEPGGQWGLVNGNSFAAAHVSGLLALARQMNGRRAVLASAWAGGGSVDACSTLRRSDAASPCRPAR